MKNADKILNALKQAYPQAHFTVVTDNPMYEERVFLDGNLIARFSSFFWDKDFDKPDIEIKIKAPLDSIEDFLIDAEECDGGFYQAVERGLKEWREGSHQNN